MRKKDGRPFAGVSINSWNRATYWHALVKNEHHFEYKWLNKFYSVCGNANSMRCTTFCCASSFYVSLVWPSSIRYPNYPCHLSFMRRSLVIHRQFDRTGDVFRLATLDGFIDRISIPAYAKGQQWWQSGVPKNEMSLMSFIFKNYVRSL
jgi:hypothetical protein